jgi:hypothetical protein
MPRDDQPATGFMNRDYVLTFYVRDPARNAALVALCRDAWRGDEVTPSTWELSTALGPHDLEQAILEHLGGGDRAVFYYLSADKRIFRVAFP